MGRLFFSCIPLRSSSAARRRRQALHQALHHSNYDVEEVETRRQIGPGWLPSRNPSGTRVLHELMRDILDFGSNRWRSWDYIVFGRIYTNLEDPSVVGISTHAIVVRRLQCVYSLRNIARFERFR